MSELQKATVFTAMAIQSLLLEMLQVQKRLQNAGRGFISANGKLTRITAWNYEVFSQNN
jgi:hypothetical protein